MKQTVHTIRTFLSRLMVVAMLPLLVAISLLVPADSVHAQTSGGHFEPGGFSSPSQPALNAEWAQINSADSARQFFGASDNSTDLYYRNLINGEWEAPTADNADGPAKDAIDGLVGHGRKVRVQIFRIMDPSHPDPTQTLYEDPIPSNHRNLTLAAGNFSETTAGNSAATTFLDTPFGLPKGAGLAISAVPVLGQANAIASFADGVFGGNDQKGQWIFTGDGNSGVQMTITCGDGGGKGSRFVYVGNQKPIETAYNVSDLGDDQKISDVNYVLHGSTFGHRNYDSTALSAYLCPAGQSKDSFDHLCNDKLKLPTCVSDKKGLLDALGGLFNPIQWALDQLQNVVSFFMGFVVDGLRQITDVGDLAGNSGVTSSWKVMRDLANVLFILTLGAIAFSTMLRIDTQRYNIRALLPRLIAAIIAVNFSLLLVTVLVDVATVVGNPFLSGINVLLDQNPVSNPDSLIGGASGVGESIVMILASIVVIVILIALLLMLVVRVVMIWLLAAFAPLALLASVLPFSRSLASQWLKQLIKWVFMAPIAYAILWVGARFLSAADSLDAFILSILVFIGVCAAAVIIPLKLGGEIMQRAKDVGKAAGGKGLKRTGIPAALQQHQERAERTQARRGADLRRGFNQALSGATGGRIGSEAATEAQAQQRGTMEREADMYAGQFNGRELGDMQNRFPAGSRMHETLGMAQEIRSGLYSERKAGEQAAQALTNFQAKPLAGRVADVGRLNSRNVSEFSPEVMGYLANTNNPEDSQLLQQHLGSAAVVGVMEQGNPQKVRALREAHQNGRISPTAINNLSPKERALYEHRIVQGKDTALPPPPPGDNDQRIQEATGRRNESTTSGGLILPETRRTKDEPPNPEDTKQP